MILAQIIAIAFVSLLPLSGAAVLIATVIDSWRAARRRA